MSSPLFFAFCLLCLAVLASSQIINTNMWPYFMGQPSENSMGNQYMGNDLAGIYLLCNGIGCPARG